MIGALPLFAMALVAPLRLVKAQVFVDTTSSSPEVIRVIRMASEYITFESPVILQAEFAPDALQTYAFTPTAFDWLAVPHDKRKWWVGISQIDEKEHLRTRTRGTARKHSRSPFSIAVERAILAAPDEFLLPTLICVQRDGTGYTVQFKHLPMTFSDHWISLDSKFKFIEIVRGH